MISKIIMYEGGFADCKIPYVDCRGYYDLAAQIAGLIFTGIIAYMAISNYRQLKQEKKRFQQSEYEQSLIRKVQINLLNLIFLVFFIGHIIYSMILFQLSFEQSPTQLVDSNLNKWYKCSQIIFIILLNLLLLSVASLYCRGLTFFFIVKQLPAPFWFGSKAKYIIWFIVIYCFGVAIAGCVLVMVKTPQDQFIQNLLVSISTALSTIIFIFYRFNYHSNIFLSVKMCRKVLMRQKVYNILVFISSFLRIGLCILAMIGLQWQGIRKFDAKCNDTSIFHSLILLFNTVAVDLFPPFVFARIFTTFQRQRHLNNDIEQTLFSIQPSQMVSALSRE